MHRTELVDVCQHILCDLTGPGTMQEESALDVLHLNVIVLFLRVLWQPGSNLVVNHRKSIADECRQEALKILTSFGSRLSKNLLARLVRGLTFTSSLFRFTIRAYFGLQAASLLPNVEGT